MSLTTAQLQTLKAWVVANNNSLFDGSAVAALNATASPTYKVWKTTLNLHDFIEMTDLDGASAVTTFAGGGGTGSLIDRSVGERDVFRFIWNSALATKPYLANVRVMLYDIFSGTAALAQMNRRHFWARGQRPVTVFEKLYVGATVGGPLDTASNGNNPAGQSGTRGGWTNPDALGLDDQGARIESPVNLQTVVASEST